jgi:N4-gp56 family major capsid protein
VAITQTSDVTWDQTAYDMFTRFALRNALIFDRFATVTPTRQSMPGASVVFNWTSDLATATTPLTEATDVTPVTVTDNQITVSLNEYGLSVGRTRKLNGFSYIPVDPALANLVGYNSANTLDDLALAQVQAGSNVIYAAGTTRIGLAAGNVLTSAKIRQAVAKLRGTNVMPWYDGGGSGLYAGVIHPDVAYDLYGETGDAAWRAPHNYSAPENIWNAEIGTYAGVRWMEVAKAPMFADAASTTVDVYATLIFGQEALAKTWSRSESAALPETVVSPVTDKLRRFYHVGWYWLGGYGRFRTQSIYRIESSSSIGVNT